MIIYVNVKPNSLENKIDKLSDNKYNISITEKAENGKANIALIKILSKEFNVSYKNSTMSIRHTFSSYIILLS